MRNKKKQLVDVQTTARHVESIVSRTLTEQEISGSPDAAEEITFQEQRATLYKHVQHEKNFGVARGETDPMYHLSDLLEVMQAKHERENEYQAKGSVIDSKGKTISLVFEFEANDQEDADRKTAEFKRMMIGKGLRVWLAFWKKANEKGARCFECMVSEIMEAFADGKRKSYFSDKERDDFWQIVRCLARTQLRLEWPVKKCRRDLGNFKNDRIKWIEQPLLEIIGGEQKLGEKCPVRLSVNLLRQEIAGFRFVPSTYANATLTLHPNLICLAFVIQSRAAQMENGAKVLCFDWPFLIKMRNLGRTAQTNFRQAKSQTRQSMNLFRKRAIIEDFREDLDHRYVQIKPCKIDVVRIDRKFRATDYGA